MIFVAFGETTFSKDASSSQDEKGRLYEETAFQAFQTLFLQRAADGKTVELDADFLEHLRKAQGQHELFRLGLISGLTCTPLQQNEMDALFLRHVTFQTDLAAYLAGRFAGEQAAKVYAHLQARTFSEKESVLGTLTPDYVRQKTVLFLKRTSTNSYSQTLAATLEDPELINKAQAILAEETSVRAVQSFAQLLATEYAVHWLQAYVSDPSWEPFLLLLPAEVLALAGQLALVRFGDRSVLLAAYTLATSKDKNWAGPLDALVQQLIEQFDTKTFEAFMVKPTVQGSQEQKKAETPSHPPKTTSEKVTFLDRSFPPLVEPQKTKAR